jgi:hypothetical protein
MNLRILSCAAALLMAAPAGAAIESADSRAIVITPLSLLKVDDLDFGSLVPSALSGIVSIDANSGAQSAIGGVTAYGAANSRRGYFVGAGTQGQLVVIVLGSPPLLSDGGGNTMPVLALTLDGPPLRAIPADRILHIYVGGILSVGADQAPGDYAGTFNMTVNYF